MSFNILIESFDRANFTGINQITNGIITPAQLTANVNNYNPTGFDTCNLIYQDLDANNREITGFLAPAVGINRIIAINNISTLYDLRFTHNDAASVTNNRLLMRDNMQKSIKPNETAIFFYDHNVNRWRTYNRVG
jgi:hypothetical protein